MRGLTWRSAEQRAVEFHLAKRYLLRDGSPAPAGTVLDNPPDRVSSFKHPITDEPVKLTYRFQIDAKGNVYAKATAAYAAGNFGSVTIAETEDGRRWVIKEADKTRPARYAIREAEIVIDLGLGDSFLEVGSLHPTVVIKYLGEPLALYLERERASLSDDEILDLAIKVVRAVRKFQTGVYSKSRTGYAHLDIKLENVTIDFKKDVHLVDFGFSEEIDGAMTERKGTPYNLLPLASLEDIVGESKRKLDDYALERTLYKSPTIRVIGRAKEYSSSGLCVVLDEPFMLRHPNLQKVFSTVYSGEDATNKCPSVSKQEVALIFERFGLVKHLVAMNDKDCMDFVTAYEKIETVEEKDRLSAVKRIFGLIMAGEALEEKPEDRKPEDKKPIAAPTLWASLRHAGRRKDGHLDPHAAAPDFSLR